MIGSEEGVSHSGEGDWGGGLLDTGPRERPSPWVMKKPLTSAHPQSQVSEPISSANCFFILTVFISIIWINILYFSSLIHEPQIISILFFDNIYFK